ncbi:MAG: hypothetical protein JW860_01145 [Sedimentisphaerales bacterium]|nr:hypothetical protein [Sedimentisphaerales bacterium]
MRHLARLVAVCGFIALLISFGCETAPSGSDAETVVKESAPKIMKSQLRCTYKVGDVEKVRWTDESEYKVWVQMEGQEPGKPKYRDMQKEIVMNTQVESVEEDGTAIINVVWEQVNMSIKYPTPKDKTAKRSYFSDAKTTRSDWPGEPELAGVSYKIKMAPDTTIKEVMGLDELRKKLNISNSDSGVAALLQEDRIKMYHQRDFILHCPAEFTNQNKQGLPGTYEKNIEVPDEMIKAQAIKMVYQVEPVLTTDSGRMIKVVGKGTPLYVLPEGMSNPPQPDRFDKNMIKSMSNMDELTVTVEGDYNLTTGTVTRDLKDIKCTLIILEKNINFGDEAPNTPQKQAGDNEMFTTVVLKTLYEVIE